jgi:hypothetical protein
VKELSSHRVDITFVARPPVRQVARASGVTDVEVDGCRLQCHVWGSFQPFLEALHGSEVVSLTSHTVIVPMTSSKKRSATS